MGEAEVPLASTAARHRSTYCIQYRMHERIGWLQRGCYSDQAAQLLLVLVLRCGTRTRTGCRPKAAMRDMNAVAA